MKELMKIILVYINLNIISLTTTGNQTFSFATEDIVNWPGICQSGKKQSPIEIPRSYSLFDFSEYMRIKSSNYTRFSTNIEVQNNRMIIGNLTGKGSVFAFRKNITYKFDSVHFELHYKSEHTYGGLQDDLELQIIHEKDVTYFLKNNETDPEASFSKLIISVRINASGDRINTNFQNLNLPNGPTKVEFDFNSLIPVGQPYFVYEGSLTSSPCSENVYWVLNKNFITISNDQLLAIRTWITSKISPEAFNARKTKQKHERSIWYQYFPQTTDNQNPSSEGNMWNFKYVILILLFLLF